MEITQSLSPILASILIGALIGLEREKTKIESHGISPVGVRTDILVCLFGAIAALFGQINIWIFFTCLTALLILTISGYIYMSITHGRVGITTEISTILVFLFGAMCAWGFIQLAGVLAILTALILSVREYLHNAPKSASMNFLTLSNLQLLHSLFYRSFQIKVTMLMSFHSCQKLPTTISFFPRLTF